MHAYHANCLILLMTISSFLQAQTKTDSLLQQVFSFNTNPVFRTVMQHSDIYRLQIIYTQINRDANNHLSFKNYFYNYNPQLYFNPASMVKLPLVFLALEKMNDLNKKGVNKYTTVLFDSSQTW